MKKGQTNRVARKAAWGRLLQFVRPYLGMLLLSTLLMSISSAIGLAAPFLAGRLIDAAIVQKNASRIDAIILLLVGLFTMMGIVTYFQSYLTSATGARLLMDLRTKVIDHLVTLSAPFYTKHRAGELLSRVGSDLTITQTSLTGAIPTGIRGLVMFIATLTILLFLQTRLTLLVLAVIPPVVLIGVLLGKKLRKLATNAQDALADSAAGIEETLNGIRTVQAWTREAHESRRCANWLNVLLDIQLRNARVQSRVQGFLTSAAWSAFALPLWYGGHLMLKGELTPGQLTSFLLYAGVVGNSVGILGGLVAGYQTLLGASARVFELLDTPPTILEAPHPIRLSKVSGHIRFQNVCFQYPGTPAFALENINIDIEPGETIGLVGPSGAGKSTAFSLLHRFYDPTSGAMLLDNQDLRSISLKDLRHSIGTVSQESFIFRGTVEENIRYGRLTATPEEIRAAAAAAWADEFIQALPLGYQEVIGPRGVNLSAGQRQRIALARVFLANSRILLFDEATSSLDPDSEQKVHEAFSRLLRGRTTLIIAHRMATARMASRILVFERGRLIDSGPHETLFASNELYRRYWEFQSLKDSHRPAETPQNPKEPGLAPCA